MYLERYLEIIVVVYASSYGSTRIFIFYSSSSLLFVSNQASQEEE